MTVKEIAIELALNAVNLTDPDKEITCGYAGDLLSHVLTGDIEGACWFTVMNSVNVCAVAEVKKVACVVLCDKTLPSADLSEAVKKRGVNLFMTDLDVFSAATKFHSVKLQ